jgi:hypothetical protein
VSESSAPSATFDSQRLNALLEKVLPFARAADAVAQRLVGKVRTLAMAGIAAAAWLIYACYTSLGWSWAALLPIVVVLLIAPLMLWRVVLMLHSTIGLPQRITDTANRLLGKANDYRELYNNRAQVVGNAKPTLRQLWSTGKSLLDVKGLSDEAREVVSLAGGALVIANPVFAIVLTIAAAVTALIVLIAVVVGISHLI